MTINSENIKSLIEQGENSSIEFKNASVKPDAIAKEIIAFANTSGGVILIGIEDDKSISGIDDSKNWEEWTMNIIRNNILPPLNIQFNILKIENKKIAVIEVPKGINKPYQALDGNYYIRIGSTNRIASIQELMRLFQESGMFHYDMTSVPGTSIKSLNLNIVTQYFKYYDIDFENQSQGDRVKLLTNTDLLDENGEVTVAGLLVFGIQPEKYLYQSGITFVHYKGTDLTGELIDNKHIEGCIDFVISTALAAIKNNIKVPATIVGLKRVDIDDAYSDKVFRELISNCVAHRNYSITGSKIRIFMFDNRIEFISPGKLPNTITIEKLSAGVSFRRNQLLTKFLVAFRFIDTFGRGIPNVIAEVKRRNKSIVFEEIGEEFKVTLFL